MAHRTTFADWAALGLALAALLALLLRLIVGSQVADLQQQATQRQSQIASANVLGQVNNQLIRMLVEAAAATDDRAILGLLEQNGIKFEVGQNNAGQTAAAATEGQP